MPDSRRHMDMESATRTVVLLQKGNSQSYAKNFENSTSNEGKQSAT